MDELPVQDDRALFREYVISLGYSYDEIAARFSDRLKKIKAADDLRAGIN